MKQVFSTKSQTNLGTTTSYDGLFCGYAFSTTEANYRDIVPCAGKVRNLRVYLMTAPSAGKSRTFTVMQNASTATALTVTISDTDTTAIDITHEITVSAGDTLSLRGTATAGTASSYVSWSVEFEGTTAKDNIAEVGGYTTSNTNTYYFGVTDKETAGSDASQVNSTTIPHDCTLKSVYIDLSTAPGSGKNYAFTLMKNGVADVSTTVTISDTATTGNITGLNISLAAGDYISLKEVPSSSPALTNFHAGLCLNSTVDGNSIMADKFIPNASAAYYHSINSVRAFSQAAAAENFSQTVCGATSFSIKNMYIYLSNPGVGKTLAFYIRNNAVDTAVTASLSGAGSGAVISDLTHTATFADTNLLNISSVPTSTPTVAIVSFSSTQYIPSGRRIFVID